MVGIYAIVNKVNGKMYIGQSINITARWKNHRKTSRNDNDKGYHYPLYRAIRKYDLENFDFIILEICNEEELDDKEIYWIDFYDTTNEDKGYNLLDGGGGGNAGRTLTQEEVDEIYQLLLETNMKQEDIAAKFDVTHPTISYINTGYTWKKSECTYPLREQFKVLRAQFGSPKINKCIDCGKKITKGATRCVDCHSKNGNITRKVALEDRPSRDELKYLIRTMPFTRIGQQYGVSDNAIRKWCDVVGLPRKSSVIKSYTDEEWDLI